MNYASIDIGSQTITDNSPPFLVAELSANHGGSLERVLELVDAAHWAGAHAIKLQTYTPSTMTPETGTFRIAQHLETPWHGQALRDLYQKAQLPWEWHRAIFERARLKGLLAFSSAFDETSVDFLETLNVPAYKVASFESTHLPLLHKISKTGKPLLLSTGTTTLGEICSTIEALHSWQFHNFILLKCTSAYPARAESANLKTLAHLRELFGHLVGLSDHTLGVGTAAAAVALGACVVEKHLTLDRSIKTPDADFSLQPEEFRQLVEVCMQAHASIGQVAYNLTPQEQKARHFRRSIYARRSIQAGARLTLEDLSISRPALGLSPLELPLALNRKAKSSIPAGTPIEWSLLD